MRIASLFLVPALSAGLLVSTAHAALPFITEVMPDNATTLSDEDGQFPDWLEIYNPGPGAVNLLGWFLTDTPLNLTNWTFPSVNLPAGGFLVVFASGKNRTNNPARLHTSFQLDAGGEYFALVKPDGVTVASAFSPVFPSVKRDVAFGVSQRFVSSQLLSNSTPRVLVPTGPGDLPGNWNQPGFAPGATWLSGFAPPSVGFDTSQPAPAPVNLGPGGVALQSSTFGAQSAGLALNTLLTDYTQTLNSDGAPFWQVTLVSDSSIHSVVLRNRPAAGSRLRDITVDILSADGVTTNFTSTLLNPENTGFAYPNGPVSLSVDLVALTGGAVGGRIVRVSRIADPDLSGTAGQGGDDEIATLSLAEVEVNGIGLGGAGSVDVNLARTGTPAPTAMQSSTNGGFTANLAIDGANNNFSHTISVDTNATWQVNLGRTALIKSVNLHNRESCCQSRLRDITVRILDASSNVVYTSGLLNPLNTGYTFSAGPANLLVDLTNSPVIGQFVRVNRKSDPGLVGSGGQGNADETNVLALGEVTVIGSDVTGYRPYIRTDLQTRMLGSNASAFLLAPFTVVNPSSLLALTLRMRYDDGFIAYLNGVEIARRNAPASPAWDSSATASRSFVEGLFQESIDVSAAIVNIVPGANVLAIQGLNAGAGDVDFLLQPELVATDLIVTSNVFLYLATPGGINNSDYYYDEVGDTHFSVDRGFFTNAFSLSITCATPGAVIYYSFNADEPSPAKGTLYTGPLTITNTSVVRARAWRDSWKPSDVDTHTYLFLADVLFQVPNWPQDRIPPRYFPSSWGANSNDYGMDPNVVSRYTSSEWYEALTQIPTMSIVTEMGNLFDPARGIYANASGHGEDWERPMSLELLDPAEAVPGRFQENGGLRIRGGFSRNPQFFKHSFRIFFNRTYGASKLHYPLFEEEGAQEFEKFDLRTSQNYSWPRNESPTFDTMVREVFCRKTLGDLGQPYRRSRYYHLYLNGQYWGLYETDERPSAAYGESYFGGTKTNYDVVKCGNRSVTPNFATEATDGNFTAWSNLWVMCQVLRTNASTSNYFRPLGCDPDGTRNPSIEVLIDVDNLIDYMLEIFFSGDGDATLSAFLGNIQANNWFGMRDRSNPNIGFRFFNSDCEHTMGSPSSQVDRTGPFGGPTVPNEGMFMWSNPQWMHEELARNLEYRVRFADHVQKHFFNGGALTLEACTNRFIAKARQINKAIRAYSARWGDALNAPNTATFYGESDWTNAITFCLNWLPPRAGLVLAQLTSDSLFPTIGAPALSSYGGFVTPGFSLTMSQTNVGGVIYFTLDGTDPRLVGGATSGAAQIYGAPVALTDNTSVRARVKVGTNWSAAIDALFTTSQYFRDLAVTEIMFNPPGTTNVSGDEFEFLEIKNNGTNNLNLSGVAFTAGITFTFTNGTRLAPGAFFVLARNRTQFQARYPSAPLNGIYSGHLDNSGETLTLSHILSGPIFSVTYGDGPEWPQAADGLGFSLVPVNAAVHPNSDQPTHWRASSASGGSPGAEDPPPTIPAVLINEILTHTLTADFIELFNPTGSPVNVGGWFLTDDPAIPGKYRIPDGTMIAGNDYLVITEPSFNPLPGAPASFTLSAEGEQVFLFSGDASTNLTGYSHGLAFGAAAQDVTFGRHVISTGEEQFPAQLAATPGAANAGPRIADVVISEIQYHPRPGDDSFVEIQNRTANPVALFDEMRPTNTWRINGLEFTFPTNVVLPGGGLALIVTTTPAAFRAKYNVPAMVPVFGPYGGTLQNSGELLELQRLDFRGTNNYAWVTLDAVRYNDRAPWPAAADGAGASLQRLDVAAYGNDPINWKAATPGPGIQSVTGGAPAITQQPASLQTVQSGNASFSVTATGTAPLGYQWQFNSNNIVGANNSLLLLANVAPSQAGAYRVLVLDGNGSAESSNAFLTVLLPATITLQPTNVDVKIRPDPGSDVIPFTNATFVVAATTANPPLSYQWRSRGTNLTASQKYLGPTTGTLTVSNVTTEDFAEYTCAITDANGTILSSNVMLFPLVRPTFLLPFPNQTQTVVAGAAFPMSAVLSNGWPPPFGFQWRVQSTAITNLLSYTKTNFVVYPASVVATGAVSGVLHRVVVTNRASPSLTINAAFYVTTLADTDHDGIPDSIEMDLHLDPNNAADALLDLDGDGMSNLAEFQAGTDASSTNSYLRIDQSITSGAALVYFAAVSNRTYTVQYTDVLPVTNPASWRTLADIILRTTNRVENLLDPGWTTNRFYRVVTPQRP